MIRLTIFIGYRNYVFAIVSHKTAYKFFPTVFNRRPFNRFWRFVNVVSWGQKSSEINFSEQTPGIIRLIMIRRLGRMNTWDANYCHRWSSSMGVYQSVNQSIYLSIMRAERAIMAERIEVLLNVDTTGDPRNIVLDRSSTSSRREEGGSMRPSPNHFGHLLFLLTNNKKTLKREYRK